MLFPRARSSPDPTGDSKHREKRFILPSPAKRNQPEDDTGNVKDGQKCNQLTVFHRKVLNSFIYKDGVSSVASRNGMNTLTSHTIEIAYK